MAAKEKRMERSKVVVKMRDEDKLMFKEIARILGFSTTRAQQLYHSGKNDEARAAISDQKPPSTY
jgi:DNA-directed RNA polymerase specialized sigma subunit